MAVTDNCSDCDAYCCRHVALHIDKPVSKKDYDQIRWYLLHENVWVSIDFENNWILEFRTPCRNIASDHKCIDYENRPKICRDYPSEDQLCERQTDKPFYRYLFKNDKEFEKYLDKKGIDWKWKCFEKKKKKMTVKKQQINK
ncbi:MAG: hypothetical protein GXY77_06230 [Fibrobacter sp.]|nr:hypothetical protein [Fibrobacter sp.]